MPADQTDSSQNPNSGYYLSNSDLNATKLVSIEFEGKKFSDRRRSMMIALSARNKLCFVDGSLIPPAANSQNYKIWTRCNDLVISWMLASLEPKIARSVLYLKTARAIWLELADMYCRESGPQLFSVQQQLSELSQGDDEEVSSFFTKIKMLWDQLDGLEPLPVCECTGCSCNLTQQLLKTQQNQRLIQFLMKLNEKYEHPKSTILMMNPLPTISKACGLLLQEEQQKEVHSHKAQTQTESAAFNARRFDNKSYRNQYNSSSNSQYAGTGNQFRNNNNNNRNNLFCEHCKMRNHTIEKCWKLHGYPKDFKGKGKRVAAAAQLDEYTPKEIQAPEEGPGVVHATFTEEQYTQLMNCLHNQQIANQAENFGSH
ncbi:uncharacterized protein [Spinacia oleracea]|uniref:Retrotransposon Copia-like N-terminal domain-containing protein n=1 Tax=Spinacia oleracea TaxID=3562 RepID=A0A9R0HVL8_SPIOL|nr:uncharacterized protein LOC110777540 [Spinacia oleracea]